MSPKVSPSKSPEKGESIDGLIAIPCKLSSFEISKRNAIAPPLEILGARSMISISLFLIPRVSAISLATSTWSRSKSGFAETMAVPELF